MTYGSTPAGKIKTALQPLGGQEDGQIKMLKTPKAENE